MRRSGQWRRGRRRHRLQPVWQRRRACRGRCRRWAASQGRSLQAASARHRRCGARPGGWSGTHASSRSRATSSSRRSRCAAARRHREPASLHERRLSDSASGTPDALRGSGWLGYGWLGYGWLGPPRGTCRGLEGIDGTGGPDRAESLGRRATDGAVFLGCNCLGPKGLSLKSWGPERDGCGGPTEIPAEMEAAESLGAGQSEHRRARCGWETTRAPRGEPVGNDGNCGGGAGSIPTFRGTFPASGVSKASHSVLTERPIRPLRIVVKAALLLIFVELSRARIKIHCNRRQTSHPLLLPYLKPTLERPTDPPDVEFEVGARCGRARPAGFSWFGAAVCRDR